MKPGICRSVNLFGLAVLTGIVLSAAFTFRHPWGITAFSDDGVTALPLREGEASVTLADNNDLPDPLVIPLKRAGRLFLIDATIDGVTGNLIFDTGSRNLLINSTYFRDHVSSRQISSKGITGDVGEVRKINLGKVEFASMEFSNLTAETANLGHFENLRGIKVLGMLGFSLIRNHEIVIDPLRNELKLYKIDGAGRRLNHSDDAFIAHHSQKIESNLPVLFLKGRIGGKTLNFCFDTAAETNVISSGAGKNVLSTITITRRTSLKGAGTGVREVLFGRMNDFTLGEKSLGNMETVITNLFALHEVYNTPIDGILGQSFLEHGIVCVNFVNRRADIRFIDSNDR